MGTQLHAARFHGMPISLPGTHGRCYMVPYGFNTSGWADKDARHLLKMPGLEPETFCMQSRYSFTELLLLKLLLLLLKFHRYFSGPKTFKCPSTCLLYKTVGAAQQWALIHWYSIFLHPVLVTVIIAFLQPWRTYDSYQQLE